jgi:SnoaL-like domain
MRNADIEAIAAVYAEGAAFRSHPFRPLESPRDYAARVLAAGPVADAVFERPLIDGDRAAVEYRVIAEGEEIRGITVLRFDDQGQVVDHRDYWAALEIGSEASAAASKETDPHGL